MLVVCYRRLLCRELPRIVNFNEVGGGKMSGGDEYLGGWDGVR